MSESTEMRLSYLREDARDAIERLRVAVADACPRGAEHRPVQHRDKKPPWCNACGRDSDGNMRRD